MKPERIDELRNLIDSDQTAKSLFDLRHYADCAMRLQEIAPPVRKPLPLSQLGVIELYSDNPIQGVAVLDALDEAAKTNPLIRRIVAFMGPGNPGSSLPDFSLSAIRQALIAPKPVGGIGLSETEAGPILRAGEQPDSFTGVEIESIAMNEDAV